MKIGALWGIWVEFFSCGLHSCRVRLTIKEDIEKALDLWLHRYYKANLCEQA